MVNVKRILIMLLCVAGAAVCEGRYFGTALELKVDSILECYSKVANRQPYKEGADQLLRAANTAFRSDDHRPNLVLRAVYEEYRLKHDIPWDIRDGEYQSWAATEQQYKEFLMLNRSWGISLLAAKVRLNLLKYRNESVHPLELLEIARMLETMPPYEPEPQLQKYYALLPYKVDDSGRKKLLADVRGRLKHFTADQWLFSGVCAILTGAPGELRQEIVSRLEKADRDKAAALRAYDVERHRPEGVSDEVLAQMARGEEYEHFAALGGTIVKARALMNSDSPDALRAAARLAQEAMEKCLDVSLRNEAKDIYARCQSRLTVLELDEQARNLDVDEALPSELVALAIGYESVDGYRDKAIEYYRLAAEMGDEGSLCRVCVYDIEEGFVEEDVNRVINAAKTILDHAGSDFLPFRYNAIYVRLYGIDGRDPDAEAVAEATRYFDEFKTRYPTDPRRSLYRNTYYLCGDHIEEHYMQLPDEDDDIDSYFSGYADALRYFAEGVQHERQGDYEAAQEAYIEAWKNNHPVADAKYRLMEKKLNTMNNKSKP